MKTTLISRLFVRATFALIVTLLLTACQIQAPAEVEIQPVVLLIVDDFSVNSDNIEQPGDTDELCLATPNGQAYYTSSGLTTQQGIKSHGELVSSEIRDLLKLGDPEIDSLTLITRTEVVATTGEMAFRDNAGAIKNVQLWDTTSGYLLSVEVDTHHWAPDLAANNILQAIKNIDSTNWTLENATHKFHVLPAKGWVINMSFALIPCNLATLEPAKLRKLIFENYVRLLNKYLEGIKSENPELIDVITRVANGDDLGEVLDELDSLPNVQFSGVVCDLIQVSSGTQALCELTRDLQDEQNKPVITVAAAGNFAFPFPFAPALFPNVVSVSSRERSYDFPSNRGEVQASGIHPTAVYTNNLPISGTSFAAPRVSLQIALYLLRSQGTICRGEDDSPSSPPLDTTIFNDQDFRMAADDLCPELSPQ